MSYRRRVLVTGATGRQGGAVTRMLLDHGHDVRIFVRDRDVPVVGELRYMGARVRGGDFDRVDSIRAALADCDAVFVMSTPSESGTAAEVRWACNVLDAARLEGVGQVVLSSASGSQRKSGVEHLESKRLIEGRLETLGLPYTLLRPVMFMEELLSPWVLPGLKRGVLKLPLPPTRRIEMIPLADLAAMVALVIEKPDRYRRRHIDLASDEINGLEMVAMLTRVTGRPVRYEEVSLEEVHGQSREMANLFRWLRVSGYDIDILEIRYAHPEVEWHTFERWALWHDWPALLGYQRDDHVAKLHSPTAVGRPRLRPL